VTLIGNSRARDLAVASALASAWMERLRYDATRWTFDPGTNTTTENSTQYLTQAALDANAWQILPEGEDIEMEGALTSADITGMDSAESPAFCVNYRVTTLM